MKNISLWMIAVSVSMAWQAQAQSLGGRDKAEGVPAPSSVAPTTSIKQEAPTFSGSDRPRWYRPSQLTPPVKDAKEEGRFKVVLADGVYYIFDYETPKGEDEDTYELYEVVEDGCRRTKSKVVITRTSLKAPPPTNTPVKKHGRPD